MDSQFQLEKVMDWAAYLFIIHVGEVWAEISLSGQKS